MSGKTVDTDLDAGVLHNSDWTRRWEEGDTNFHQSKHDAVLESESEQLFGGKTKSVFVPLCGKTLDMIWLYTKGHTVCGVEIVEQPVKELFEENSIPYDVEHVENVGNRYKSKDGRLMVYAADLFDVSKDLCGQFDIIWDSRSLVAINLSDHQIYRDLLLSLMKPDGQYYLSTFEYDPAVWPGPPHSLTDSCIKDLYGGRCNIDMVSEKGKTQVVEEQTKHAKPSSAQEALRLSSYIYNRWYRMTHKEQ